MSEEKRQILDDLIYQVSRITEQVNAKFQRGHMPRLCYCLDHRTEKNKEETKGKVRVGWEVRGIGYIRHIGNVEL